METILLPHLPHHPLQVCLFRHLENAVFLRKQLLQGNTDFDYAFLDASVLLTTQHVLAACFRAVNDLLNDRLRSRNVHSEIVFSLSPNNNIAESFRRFGISDDSKNLLAIKVGADAAQVEGHLRQNVEGEIVAFSDEVLAEMCDQGRIRKSYRVDAPKKGEADLQWRREAEAFVVGSMALKGS